MELLRATNEGRTALAQFQGDSLFKPNDVMILWPTVKKLLPPKQERTPEVQALAEYADRVLQDRQDKEGEGG